MISDSDATHLQCVEHKSFAPIGWLYARVFEDLRERGLVAYTLTGGFIISDEGAKQLAEWRANHGVSEVRNEARQDAGSS